MSRLEEVLEAMDLKPGQTIRCRVKGQEVEVRVLTIDESDLAPEDPWFAAPSRPPGHIIRARPGPPRQPSHFDPTDETPQ